MKKIKIKVNNHQLNGVLHDTPAGKKIWNSLPISSRGNIWGDEIYFSINADVKLNNAQEVVNEGDLAYWPPGSAFCIFYGPTPVSVQDEVRPASSVEVFGKVTDDFNVLKKIKRSPNVVIERAES
ncbi:cyclophilin-like fold protein [Scopulibacillus cellulosilyticus]|uniref:Cyclophilin-like fold protein n=1 Tax=Scopulibacillus cellulosilyticus TaxID=2665665 RepID=A0ABW2Q4P6_9BACL